MQSLINSEEESMRNLVADIYNTLVDCKANLSMLIDPEFAIELSYSVMVIAGTSPESRKEIEANCRNLLITLSPIVDRFSENFPGLLGPDRVSMIYGSELIARSFVMHGYEPSGFNEELRWELKEAIGRVRYTRTIKEYVYNAKNDARLRTPIEPFVDDEDDEEEDTVAPDRKSSNGIIGRIVGWLQGD